MTFLHIRPVLITFQCCIRVYLHGSKLAFKPSFKPTKIDAAVKIKAIKYKMNKSDRRGQCANFGFLV